MQQRFLKRSLLTGAAIAVIAAGIGAYGSHLITPAQALVTPMANAAKVTDNGAALPDFTTIVAKYGPAVVNISVSGDVKTGGLMPGFPQLDPNDPFYQFFRHFQFEVPHGEVPIHGLGSGFIVSPDGIIITNAHVVANANEVTVKLTDKREFKAKVIGIDKPTDVAVLKIDAKNLPTVTLGNSAQVKVGQWVLAIGSPFGFDNSATAGIVSAVSRSLPDEGYVPFIQTDVAVNPGNSGGPLFNTSGQVIGINSQIYSKTGGYQGLSFAIPINVVMNVEGQLLQHGHVSRGRLGVSIQEVNQSLADSFGLSEPKGALISSVMKGSAAAKAGLKPGDVILKFNGKDVARSAQLPPMVANVMPGTRATLEIWRKGKTRQMTVTLGAYKDEKVASSSKADHGHGRLGVAVRELTPDERDQANVRGGLMVEQVSGPAAQAGIEPGDLILAFNGEPVHSVGQLRTLVAKAGKHVALLIQRNDAKIFVPIDLG